MAIFLTKEQIAKLADIIRTHATWLTWRLLGSFFITEADLLKLKQLGLLPMDIKIESIRYSFVLGQLESLLKEAQWKNMDWSAIVSAATAKQTPVQEMQIRASELTAFTQFRGIEEDIQRGLFDALARATQSSIDESTVKEKIRDVVKVGVEARKNYREVAKDLADQLKENKRNWHRVASTEMHSARQQGVVSSIVSGVDVYRYAEGTDSDVAIVPDPDACDDCKRLYLDPKTGNPKVFKLSEVMDNEGSNYIKPWRRNAKAVVPPLHPHCFCRLRYVPKGWGWDSSGKYTLVDPDKWVPPKKSEKVPMNKSHELLNASSSSYIPTDEQVEALTAEEIPAALEKLESLKEMHSDNLELWHQLEALEIKVLRHSADLHRQKEAENAG